MKLILVLLASLAFSTPMLASESDYHLFVSEKHRFSMQYPASWNRAKTIHLQTIIRIESPDGDDYNITVEQLPILKSMSTQEFVEIMHAGVDSLVDKVLSSSYPDIRLIEKGTTQLSQQPAVYYITDYTLSAAGHVIPMRGYIISTKYGDKQYTLTFRTPQLFFSEYLPTIKILALAFQLTK
jgi:hypothetical protein